ncbi:MAG: hypothetical protein K5907_02050 [Treponema sp.]|nr:hypothetical protein [Treponema sp.]
MKRNIKKSGLLLVLAVLLLGLTGCANHFEGDYEEIPGKIGKYYLFDNLNQLANSLLYIENKEYGELTAGLKKKFNSQKGDAIKYEKDADPSLNYSEIGNKVIACASKVFHGTETNLGMGYVQRRGYYTGGILVYVYSDAEGRYSDGWQFDFGCNPD